MNIAKLNEHPDPTAAESYRLMAAHVPAMRALVNAGARDDADRAYLTDALGLDVVA